MVYKINESIIVIQAEATKPNDTNVVFWSHDRGTAKLRMKLVRKNGIPQSLPEGTTVPIRLIFKSATAEDGYGKHDYLATIEDRVNGIVSIVLEDNILGYVGKVEGSVYIDFPNDRSLDTAGRFTFDIKRSQIDDSTPELEDYYFNGFSQTIDKIEKILADGKQEIEQKIAESETQIEAKLKDTNDKITKANQDVATLNTNIDKTNDRIDQTNQQIGDLGKLKKMYSNSIDFGNYDYSGNPNLMSVIKASDFHLEGDTVVTDVSTNAIHVISKGAERLNAFTSNNAPSLISGKTYTISAKVKVDEGTTGDINTIRISYRKTNNGTILLSVTAKDIEIGKEITVKATGVVNYELTDLSRFYLTIDLEGYSSRINGGVIVSDIKIEEGSTATPYQPNLLDDPYWVGKTSLGKNIANKGTTFPIKSSEYQIYKANMEEEYILGQTYTITLKGTKPASQTFVAYNDGVISFGNLKPVEGLTDVWSLTFTPTKIASNAPKEFRIFQYPQSTAGACQIDWLKIEKGNTRTPNISEYKYFGEGLKDSNNPNDYSWDITPEYTEKGLNNTVSLTEPQSISGVKNFIDGLQVGSKNVATIQEYLYGADFYLGTNHNDAAGVPTKTRMGWGAEVNTVAERLGVPMKPCPLDFNSGRWEATFNRDCRVKLDVLVKVNGMGEKTGHYCYIAYWKDSEQTKQWVESNGLGQNADITNRNVVPMTGIFTAKKGDKLSVAVEIAAGKVVQMQLINAHLQELP
ncbi:BppU family phage baseplate upper protein [Enterococcus faecium]|uniref:BppU family phage baseplate upper protein n=1 Tax=Enterococcus faecium TaxID=1352 RepID=UPI001780CC8A|nr:BppU family phage baseplate upper protein [Enterococcus faecium]EGP4841515.1 BppU family phage baseplate upper protein [Enterococcus faecium]MBD9828719.1 BppU family phage baseplate upper protein [Enterococcus faecium]HEL7535460.1 BppU family phage baseplate upper protein [Enterococcus faecium]HEL7537780.1 BppU family phage baseplate upper protein [Enterococcus faecium]